MKRKDIAVLVAIALVAGLFSMVISKSIFNSPAKRSAKVPVVEALDPSFPNAQTDPVYQSFFNSKALDPTQLIKIGDNQNPVPFGTKPQ